MIHTTTLRDSDVYGQQISRTVMWADRPYDRCPTCGEQVTRAVERCPVTLNGGACIGGQLETWDHQHGCGTWLGVRWADATGRDEDEVRAELEQLRASDVAQEWDRRHSELEEALALAIETGRATGSPTERGVYLDRGRWVAWDYHPDDDSETIEVTQ